MQQRVWLAGLLLIAVALAAHAAWTRHADEAVDRTVAVAVDARELQRLSRLVGMEMGAVLERFQAAGVTAVGLHETTLGEVAEAGRIFVVPRAMLAQLDSPVSSALPADLPPHSLILGWRRSGSDAWLEGALESQLPRVAQPVADHADFALWALQRERGWQDVSIGFDPDQIAVAAGAGLSIVPRFTPEGLVAAPDFTVRLQQVASAPVLATIFWGIEISGFPDGVGQVADGLRALGAPVGVVEFNPQRGMSGLSRALDYNVVRVHSITEREMDAGLARSVALDRWMRAVRERSVRLLYVRLYLPIRGGEAPSVTAASAGAAPDLLSANLQYVEALADRLRSEGYTLGAPRSVQGRPAHIPALIAVVLAIGGVAGTLTARSGVIGRLSPRRELLMGALGALVVSALFWFLWLKGYTVMARQAAALLAALVFPVVAVASGWRLAATGTSAQAPESADQGGPHAARGRAEAAAADASDASDASETAEVADALPVEARDTPIFRYTAPTEALRRAVRAFVLATVVSLVGALFVVALLDDVRFAAKLEEFRGVKVAHVAPLLFVAAMLLPVLRNGIGAQSAVRSDAAQSRGAHAWLRTALGAGLGALLLAALAVYVLRTGNQGLPLWSVEDAARRFLEDTFVARPRTKEFLVGHPALVLAFAFASCGRPILRAGAAAMAVLGAVGQISMINTFAHIHSPLSISLLRTGYGWLLGLFLGVAGAALLLFLLRRDRRDAPDAARGRTA